MLSAALFGLLLTISVGGLFAYISATQPDPVEARWVLDVTLDLQGDGWTLHYGPVATDNNNVFGLLLETSQRRGFEVRWVEYTLPEGVLVTSINGTSNGSGGRFWQYWVDGVYGDRAADRKEIGDGAAVVWIFEVPRGGG